MNKALVLGDSHARAFSGNVKFIPVFVGPGKSVNFLNKKNAKKYLSVFTEVTSNLQNEPVIIVLGEPDTRYMLGKGWHPWLHKNEILPRLRRWCFCSISKSLKNAKFLLQAISSTYSGSVYMMSVLPGIRIDQNLYVRELNQGLKVVCENTKVSFIDIYEELISDDGLINPYYQADVVHANKNIQIHVLNAIGKLDPLNKVCQLSDSSDDIERALKHSGFVFNREFDCWKYN